MTGVTAIVPVRTLYGGKSRLSSVLEPAVRSRLIAAMLHAVIDALRAARDIGHIVVVSHDGSLRLPSGIGLLRDEGLDLNSAVQLGMHHSRSGSAAMLIVAADIPLVVASDIDTLIEAGRAADIVVATDRAGLGTNALWVNSSIALPPQFGYCSADAHEAAARQLGASVSRIVVPGLALDVDTQADLELLCERRETRYGFLRTALGRAA